MYGYFAEQQQQQQQEKPDIYAILSAEDPLDIDVNPTIDTSALVKDIFDTKLSAPTPESFSENNGFDVHPLSKPMSHSTTPSSTISSNDFKFNNQDFFNTDIMSNNSNQYQQLQANQQIQPNTQSQNEPLFSLGFPKEDPMFPSFNPFDTTTTPVDRRHSVAVSGDMSEFNLRLLQSFQPPQANNMNNNFANRRRSMMDMNDTKPPQQQQQQQQQPLFPEQQLQENLYNQFFKQPHHQQLSTVIENETQPNMAHRASMPNIFISQESRRHLNNITQRVNSISAKTSPVNTPPPVTIQLNNNAYQAYPPPTEEPAFLGRKRFHSQQFDQPKDAHLCPLPMSGISARRQSITTPQDISAWNRVVNTPKRAKVQHNTEQPLPTVVEKHEEEGYPVVTKADLDAVNKDPTAIPRRQKLRFDGDEYTPKWVRYVGQLKEGYCDTCQPGKWLQLKNSAFWYHKQFFHGISSVSGKPFASPLEQRAGDHDIIEGLCHQCREFVPICNSKRKNSVLWYRHAHKCHIYDKPKSSKANEKRMSISEPSKDYHEQLQKIYS